MATRDGSIAKSSSEEAALQLFSETFAEAYVRLKSRRPIVANLNASRHTAIEEAWAALVQRTPGWAVGVQHLAALLEKLPDVKGTYSTQDLQAAMHLVDMNGDGCLDYLEFKAYMVTVCSASIAGPANAGADSFKSKKISRRKRNRHGDDAVLVCEDLVLLGPHRLSDIFLSNLQLCTAQLAKASEQSGNKPRNPFHNLPNYDSNLAARIRAKSIDVAMRASSSSTGSIKEATQTLRSKLQLVERLRGKPLVPEDRIRRAAAAAVGSDEEEEEEEDVDEQEEEEKRRRRLQLMKEEQAMMRQGSMRARSSKSDAPAPAAGAAAGSASAPPRASGSSQAAPQAAADGGGGGFLGMFKKLGKLFGGGSDEAPVAPRELSRVADDGLADGSRRGSRSREGSGHSYTSGSGPVHRDDSQSRGSSQHQQQQQQQQQRSPHPPPSPPPALLPRLQAQLSAPASAHGAQAPPSPTPGASDGQLRHCNSDPELSRTPGAPTDRAYQHTDGSMTERTERSSRRRKQVASVPCVSTSGGPDMPTAHAADRRRSLPEMTRMAEVSRMGSMRNASPAAIAAAAAAELAAATSGSPLRRGSNVVSISAPASYDEYAPQNSLSSRVRFDLDPGIASSPIPGSTRFSAASAAAMLPSSSLSSPGVEAMRGARGTVGTGSPPSSQSSVSAPLILPALHAVQRQTSRTADGITRTGSLPQLTQGQHLPSPPPGSPKPLNPRASQPIPGRAGGL